MVGKSLGSPATIAETQEAVSSLQSNNADAVAAMRKHHRFDIRVKAIVEPGDSMLRSEESRSYSECHDISKGGCRLLAKRPLQIGSVYWIRFDPANLKVDPVFARCVRGNLLREDAFEFGMCFLTPIELPEPEESGLS